MNSLLTSIFSGLISIAIFLILNFISKKPLVNTGETFLELRILKILFYPVSLFFLFIIVMSIFQGSFDFAWGLILIIIIILNFIGAFSVRYSFFSGTIKKHLLFSHTKIKHVSEIESVYYDFWQNLVIKFNDGSKFKLHYYYTGFNDLLGFLSLSVDKSKFKKNL